MEQNETGLKGDILALIDPGMMASSISEDGKRLTVPIIVKAKFSTSEIIDRLVRFYLESKKPKNALLLKKQWSTSLNKSDTGYRDFLSDASVLELVRLFYKHLCEEPLERSNIYDGRVSRWPAYYSVNKMHEGAKRILDPIFSAALKEFKQVRAGEARAATKKEREAIKEANTALAKIGLKAVRNHTGVSVVKLEDHK